LPLASAALSWRGLKRWSCGGGEFEGLEGWAVCDGKRTKA